MRRRASTVLRQSPAGKRRFFATQISTRAPLAARVNGFA
jgi:hypothetical protein